MTTDKFAAMLKEQRTAWLGNSPAANEAIDDIEREMVSMFAEDNPNFDRERFMDAARVVR